MCVREQYRHDYITDCIALPGVSISALLLFDREAGSCSVESIIPLLN